jgi:hypothetical protein
VLSLYGTSHGTICVPREWTDKKAPDPYEQLSIAPPILNYEKLVELSLLIDTLKKDLRTLKKV